MTATWGFSTLRIVYVFEIFFQNEKLKKPTSPSDEHFDFMETIQQIALELNTCTPQCGQGCLFSTSTAANKRKQPKSPSTAAAKSLQSCPTPGEPMDRSTPGSSVHGIFQATILERGAIAFSERIH